MCFILDHINCLINITCYGAFCKQAMSTTTSCINSCIVRVSLAGRVLLVKNKKRHWEFPGGKIDEVKDKFSAHGEFIDLLKACSREFQEEVGNNVGCIGCPDKVLYRKESNTVFFVYTYQPCVFDCFEKYVKLSSSDQAIEDIREFSVDELPKLSFATDKVLIDQIIK